MEWGMAVGQTIKCVGKGIQKKDEGKELKTNKLES